MGCHTEQVPKPKQSKVAGTCRSPGPFALAAVVQQAALLGRRRLALALDADIVRGHLHKHRAGTSHLELWPLQANF